MFYNPQDHGARCDLCPLKGRTVVPPAPAKKSLRLIAVGEAPGAVEEREGAPFLGPSGACLEGTIKRLKGPTREEMHLTNAALCARGDDDENKRAAECCAPRLYAELAALPSDVTIVTLGALAGKSVLNAPGILKSRGFVWRAPDIDAGKVRAAERAAVVAEGVARGDAELRAAALRGRALLAGRRVHPTLHPAFVLRADLWRPLFELDLKRALAPLPHSLDSGVEGRFFLGGPELLLKLNPAAVSCDIETDSLDPLTAGIDCVGLSDGEIAVVLGPWRDEWAGALSFFLLGCKEVTGHNSFNFDQLCLDANGIGWSGVKWRDTLIKHHAIFSHYPQSLSHVVTETCVSEPWKILAKGSGDEKGAFKQMSAEQLAKYNAQDVILTARAAARLDAGAEEHVYQHDLRLAGVARNMIKRGMPIDLHRIESLKAELSDVRDGLQYEMRRLLDWPEFVPGNVDSVRVALYERFGLAVNRKTPKGKPATDKAVIESLRGETGPIGEFARALARYRLVTKIKSTYLDAIPINARTGRAHYNWKSFGARSGRWSCRMQSNPRYAPVDRRTKTATPEGRTREVFCAEPGHQFVYFDVRQAEANIAAHLSGDEAFMKACKGDVHANNAKIMFPDKAAMGWLESDPNCRECVFEEKGKCSCPKKDIKRGKPYRDIMKETGFALTYAADDETAYLNLRTKGFPVEFGFVCRALSNLRTVYRHYFRWVTANHAQVAKTWFMRTPVLGRIQWFGPHPKITEIANYPVQGGLADVMNWRMIELEEQEGDWLPVVAQIHDACIFHVENAEVERACDVLREIWSRPIPKMRNLILPIDLKVGQRWSDFG